MINLSNFSSPEELIIWCYDNLSHIPQREDNEFFFPTRLLKEKKGNCIDIAFLMYLYCTRNNIPAKMCSIGFEYVNNERSKTINNQAHIICTYQSELKIWNIAQIHGINDPYTNLTSPVYIGTSNIFETITNFYYDIIGGMINNLKQEWKPNIIPTKYYYKIFTNNHMKKLMQLYYDNNYKNKQNIFHTITQNAKIIELKIR